MLKPILRDNQQRSIVKQDEHIALAQKQLERAKSQSRNQ
jgi:hypothetical protein